MVSHLTKFDSLDTLNEVVHHLDENMGAFISPFVPSLNLVLGARSSLLQRGKKHAADLSS